MEGTWLAKGIGTEKDSTTGELRSSPLYVSITYPFSGGNGVEIKDDVRVRMIDGLAVEDYIMVPDDFFNFVQKLGVILFPLPEERESSNVKVNQSKTELKTEVVIVAPETIQTKENWEKINQEGPSLSGDMFLSFVEGSPCTITGTVIFHKVDANTNIGTEPGTGENPDDTWTKITSFDGLDGTWKCAYRDFRGTSNDNIYELVNTTEFILFNETGDVSVSYMTDHTQEVKELSLADNRPENEIWKEIQNICTENPSDFSYEFTQSEPYISKSFGTIPRFGEQGFETLLIGDGTNSCTYINESKTQLKMVSILESTIYVSETESQRPIKNDTEWEEYKLRQAPYLPEGDMKITFSTSTGSDGKKTYKETSTQILHKQ